MVLINTETSVVIPYVTYAQMVEIDRAMVEDFQVMLLQMMENAGRALARLAKLRFFERFIAPPIGYGVGW